MPQLRSARGFGKKAWLGTPRLRTLGHWIAEQLVVQVCVCVCVRVCVFVGICVVRVRVC